MAEVADDVAPAGSCQDAVVRRRPSVDVLLAEARSLLSASSLLKVDDHDDVEEISRTDSVLTSLRVLMNKDPYFVLPKEDFHVLREVVGRRRRARAPQPGVNDPSGTAVSAHLLAMVLADALPLDGMMLAAQALFHSLADAEVTVVPRLLARMACPPAHWSDASVLALHHGLLSSAHLLAPVDDDGQVRDEAVARAVVAAVEKHTLHVLLAECRRTSRLTKAAFRLLHTLLSTMIRWRRRPTHAVMDEVLVLIAASWEVPLPSVRECNEAALVQLQELALQSASWPEREPEQGSPGAWLALRDTATLLAETVNCVSWRSKRKYLSLKVLVRRYPGGGVAVLRDFPVLLDGLLLGMAGSHLASAATGVYRIVLADLKQADWQQHCLGAIANALAGSDRKVAMNVLNYWINPTIKAFPDALGLLTSALKARMLDSYGSCEFGNATPSVPPGQSRASFVHASYLYLVKAGRKGGFWELLDGGAEVEEQWEALQWGLRHADPWVRGVALSGVCVSARTGQPVTRRELGAARRFLEANVRADDPRLRQALLEALGWLLMRVRNSLPSLASPSTGIAEGAADSAADLEAVARFLGELHHFVLSGLVPGSNYQRRITCLGVYQLMTSYLASTATSASGCPFKGVRQEPLQHNEVLAEHLQLGSEAGCRLLLHCLLDPTDDVRNKAADILSAVMPSAKAFQVPRLEDAVALCNSPLFYKAEGGALLGSVICAWEARRGEPLGDPGELLDELDRQQRALQDNVLGAATSTPVHGLLGLVRRLLPSRTSSARPGLWAGTEARLLAFLEKNVKTCLDLLSRRSASGDAHFAPSFAEMGEAIDSIVAEDDEGDGGEVLTLTPQHQLVLNCIWLNLKVSCALAGDIVDWPGLAPQLVERFARLPVTVLVRCRHKGAIEAAGSSLQQVVKALTEQSDPWRRDLAMKLLVEFLELLLEGSTAKGTSVSRRSAGMAILIHRIVLGDQQPDKPLLQKCISCLFALLEHSDLEKAVAESQYDLPQTQALHFLRTLVADASLRVSMSPYVGQAALLCFRHLSSPLWSVRNASLQLFGALVPKIVGQGKSINEADDDEGTLVGCVGFDDLLIRFTPLSNLLLRTIESVSSKQNKLKSHADLIPALSLLACLSVCEVLPCSVKELLCFKSAFLRLLDSPISAVRFLAAEAFSRFTPLIQSANAFHELIVFFQNQNNENGRVGALTAMKLIRDRLKFDSCFTQAGHIEQKKIILLIQTIVDHRENSMASFVSKSLLLSFSKPKPLSFLGFLTEVSTVKGQVQIGMTQWITTNTKQILFQCSFESFPQALDACLYCPYSTDIPRTALLCAKKRCDVILEVQILQEVFRICLKHIILVDEKVNYETFHLLSLILLIVGKASERKVTLDCDLGSIKNIASKFLSSKFGVRCEAISLPVVAGLLMSYFQKKRTCNSKFDINRHSTTDEKEILDQIVFLMEIYSSPDNHDEQFRLAAATTLGFLGFTFLSYNLQDVEKENTRMSCHTELILKTAIQLLEDEDCDVREEAAKFVKDHAQDVPKNLNFLECLDEIFTFRFLIKFFRKENEVILFLWNLLSLKCNHLSIHGNTQIENPFDHGLRNIFAEELWIIEQTGKVLIEVVEETKGNFNLAQIFEEIFQNCNSLQTDILLMKDLSGSQKHNKDLEGKQTKAMIVLKRRIVWRLQALQISQVKSEIVSELQRQFCDLPACCRTNSPCCPCNLLV